MKKILRAGIFVVWGLSLWMGGHGVGPLLYWNQIQEGLGPPLRLHGETENEGGVEHRVGDRYDLWAQHYHEAHREVFDKAPVFSSKEFSEFIDWYNERSVEELPDTEDPTKKISAGYAVQVLSHARTAEGTSKIQGSVRAFQTKAGAYQRALKEKEIICGEIKRIWKKLSHEEIGYGSFLERLKSEFNPNLLPNLRVKKPQPPRPVGKRYRNLVLEFAYQLYGEALIQELEARAMVSSL